MRTSQSDLIRIALAEWDEREVPGDGCNPRIAEFLRSVGLPAIDETAWCSAFLYYCASKAGLERPPMDQAPAARSWAKVGKIPSKPEVGDVVLLRRGHDWQAHVGLFIKRDASRIYVLGGNQGNTVSIVPFSASRLISYRRLVQSDPGEVGASCR